jgi:hypothetical protein
MHSWLYSLFSSKKIQYPNTDGTKVRRMVAQWLKHKVCDDVVTDEIGADNGDIYEDKDAIKSHKIHFDGDSTLPVNIEYVTVFGEKHGEYKLYDRSGKLMSFAQYNHGKLHGDTVHYNVYMRQHDGSMKIVPKYICTYENGLEVSQKEVFHKEGSHGLTIL